MLADSSPPPPPFVPRRQRKTILGQRHTSGKLRRKQPRARQSENSTFDPLPTIRRFIEKDQGENYAIRTNIGNVIEVLDGDISKLDI